MPARAFASTGGAPPEPLPEARPGRFEARGGPAPPLVRLACAPSGLPEGRQGADTNGFGYSAAPQQQRAPYTRIGALGVASIPWTSNMQLATSGDADFSWVAPLDVTGEIHQGDRASRSSPRPATLA